MADGAAGERAVLNQRAVELVDAWLRGVTTSSRRLSPADLARYSSRGASAGWCVPVAVEGDELLFDVIVTTDFPFRPPRIAVAGATRFGQWPHVEPDNVLCLLSDGATVDPLKPEKVVVTLLNEAVKVSLQGISRANENDFATEFETYWALAAERRDRPAYLLFKPDSPSRLVRVWRGPAFNVIADSDEVLSGWLANGHFISGRQKLVADDGLAVWLQKPPQPKDYPQGGPDVLNFLRAEAPDAVEQFKMLTARPHAKAITILIMTSTSEGSRTAVCMTLVKPRPISRGPNRTTDPTKRGFRGHPPPDVASARFLGGAYLRGAAERADHSWIHGRDAAPSAQILAQKKVIVLGQGSLGGPLSVAFGKAGVGSITCVDPEELRFSNTGRHNLGAGSVGRNKALENAREIRATLPHLHVAGFPISFEKFRDKYPDALLSADLIVSTMADWSAEAALNAWWISSGRLTPVVFGWGEPHGCAGHAVSFRGQGACFACGMTAVGESIFRVTEWPTETLVREPGCGAHFQPYGALEMNRIVDTVAELSLEALSDPATASRHRIWAGSKRALNVAGGAWTDAWLRATDGRDQGGFLFDREWPDNDNCRYCGGWSA